MSADAIVWHDLECGSYDADLPLWRELAAASSGPVLDVGAGTGRVALDLARHGHEVVALDREAALLEALSARAGELPVVTVVADAREFELRRAFGLVLVPMQTIQLLGGPRGRARFLTTARRHLAPGGMLAVALADALETFDEGHPEPPVPDVCEVDGTVYSSRPTAVRDDGDQAAIERLRENVDVTGARTAHLDVVRLDRLDAATLAVEAGAHGLAVLAPRRIAATEEYVGSTVVIARG